MNWQEAIKELQVRGITIPALAEMLGVPYTTIRDIANGSTQEPKGMLAVRLYALYKGRKL